MTNLISCFKGTEERRRNGRGTSRQLLPSHTGRTNQEQCRQRAQIILKCALCLLIIAPPYSGQAPVLCPTVAHADTALPDEPTPRS